MRGGFPVTSMAIFAANLLGAVGLPAAAVANQDRHMQTSLHHTMEGSKLRSDGNDRHHQAGCFVTTTQQNHARGIRHWVNPCPHHELKHMNPFHSPHHKMRYNPRAKSHHRIDE